MSDLIFTKRSKLFTSVCFVLLLMLSSTASVIPVSAMSSTGIIEPIYSPPKPVWLNCNTDNDPTFNWNCIENAKNSYMNVPMIVVIDPSDGPGNYDPRTIKTFEAGIQKLKAENIIVLGYIDSKNCPTSGCDTRLWPLSTIKQWIDDYANWYGPNLIDGIMIDDMHSDGSAIRYFDEIRNYAHADGFKYTFGNPGNDISTPAYLSGQISTITGSTNTVLKTIAKINGTFPTGVAFDSANGYMYVAEQNSNQVAVINPTINVLNTTSPVGHSPTGVAFDSHNNRIYVTNNEDSTMSIINGKAYSKSRVLTTISTISGSVSHPTGIAFNPSSNALYIANTGSGTVSVIDDGTNQPVAGSPISVGSNPTGVAFDSNNKDVYVTNQISNSVSVIDGDPLSTTYNTVIFTIPGFNSPTGVAYNSKSNEVYVTNSASGTVSVISNNQLSGSPILVGVNPTSIAVNATNGYVYVTNQGSSSVSVIDGTTNTLATGFTNPISVVATPYGVAYDTNNNEVYVTHPNPTFNRISVIGGSANTVVGTPIIVGANPTGVAFDSASDNIYVADSGSSMVSVVGAYPPTASEYNTITKNITSSMGTNPFGIAFDSNKFYIYVANNGSNTVSVIDGFPSTSTTYNTVIPGGTISVGTNPTGVAFDSNKNEVFVTNKGSNSVSVINDATNTVIATVSLPAGSNPVGVTYDSINNDIYVANQGSNSVSVISDATNAVVGSSILVGFTPTGVAYDLNNNDIYVANQGSNSVSVISGATNTVGSPISVGTNPTGVAIDSNDNTIYVANMGSNTVSVIRDSTNTVIATITLSGGSNLYGIAFDKINDHVYVTSSGSDLNDGINIFENSRIIPDDATNLAGSSFPHANYDKSTWSFVAYDLGNPDSSTLCGQQSAFYNDKSLYVGYLYFSDRNKYFLRAPSYLLDEMCKLNNPSVLVTMQSQDMSSHAINGQDIQVSQSGVLVRNAVTPFNYNATSGFQFSILAQTTCSGGYAFDHWDNGSTSPSRSITASSTTYTVYYHTC